MQINILKDSFSKKLKITDGPLDKTKLPLLVKIIAIICILQCVFTCPIGFEYIRKFIGYIYSGEYNSHSTSVLIMYILFVVSDILITLSFVLLGIYLIKNKRRKAALLMYICIVFFLISILCNVAIVGFQIKTIILLFLVLFLILLNTYVDPSLQKERKLHAKLRQQENKRKYEEGNIGLSENNKGYAKINYFNMFWIFFLCSILGYILEIIWHMTVDDSGVYEERAGLLFGPFSPIYGIGGIIMTLVLNRLTNKNIVIGFLVSALLGGFFEYFASLYLEMFFGIRSWDYSHLPLNIQGRTSLRFFILWGIFGIVWLKVIFKPLIKLVNKIPWNFRYGITIIASVLMFTNIIMTTQALDCWYSRFSGNTSYIPIEKFYSENFNDNFMRHRFENMKINPKNPDTSINF